MNRRRTGAILLTLFLPVTLLFNSSLWSCAAPVYIYNSFGPGNTFNSGVVWAVSGASTSGGYRGQAEFFVPSVSGYLNTIQLATYHVSGSQLSDFFIAQDNGSGTPGPILESWTGTQNNANGILTLNPSTQLLLQAGQEYWLCDEPSAANSYNGWYENTQQIINGFAFERSQGGWSAFTDTAHSPPSGVFSVTVTPVPEPSITALTLLGLVLFARQRRRPSDAR
jgi:hypothetical protein